MPRASKKKKPKADGLTQTGLTLAELNDYAFKFILPRTNEALFGAPPLSTIKIDDLAGGLPVSTEPEPQDEVYWNWPPPRRRRREAAKSAVKLEPEPEPEPKAKYGRMMFLAKDPESPES